MFSTFLCSFQANVLAHLGMGKFLPRRYVEHQTKQVLSVLTYDRSVLRRNLMWPPKNCPKGMNIHQLLQTSHGRLVKSTLPLILTRLESDGLISSEIDPYWKAKPMRVYFINKT